MNFSRLFYHIQVRSPKIKFQSLLSQMIHTTSITHTLYCYFCFARNYVFRFIIFTLSGAPVSATVARNEKGHSRQSNELLEKLTNTILSSFIRTDKDNKAAGFEGNCIVGVDHCSGSACFPKPKGAALGTNIFEINFQTFLSFTFC